VSKAVAPKRNDLPVTNGRVTYGPTGIEFDPDLQYDEWTVVGETLDRMQQGIQWWVGDWLLFGERAYGEQYAQAMDATKLDYGYVRNLQWVAGAFELSRRRDNLSWSHHKEVAQLEPAEQDYWLDTAISEKFSQRDLRKAIRAHRDKLLRGQTPALPAGTYSLILADPPWQYDFAPTETAAIENHYPTLPVEDICALVDAAGSPVQERFAGDAVLLLWATAPKLAEAMSVMAAWGFEYKTHAAWDKVRTGMGYWFLNRHELLLVGTRGNASPPLPEFRRPSVFAEERREHSRKPDAVYEWIEAAWPVSTAHPYHLELFARATRPGWVAWGNDESVAA
jgi:N6-adenosine-specific RNA methylase IME4